MTFPNQTPRWRRYLHFWRKDIRADVDDELAFHFQTRISELTEAGHSPEGARVITLREFGDVRAVRTDLVAIDDRIQRRAERTEWLDGWRQDLIYSARSLRRTPGVTAAIIVTLALGLGANAAMFTLLNAVFLKPPSGVARPHEVRRVWTEVQLSSGSQFWPGYDYSEYDRIRRATAGIGTTTMYSYPEPAKVRRGNRVSTARSTRAPANYFPELGVRPAIGRFYTTDEDRLGAGQQVVVLSHAYWRRAFDADSAVIGEAIRIEGIPYTIIGVADRAFNGADLTATDMWVPLATTKGYGDRPWWTDRNVNEFQVLVRLAPGVSDAALERRFTDALRDPDAAKPAESRAKTTRVGSIITARGPGKLDQEVEIATRLGGVALVVLVIACANVVSLLLARAVRRRREIGMRLALGISRGRLARLILTESMLLALMAGIGAVLAAFWGGLALRALLLPDVQWVESPLDWRVLVGAVATSLAAGFAAGIVPALQSGSVELTSVLKASAREGFVRRSRLRSLLVVAQVALSVMLLVGAALFVRSLSIVRGLDLGFDASRLVYASVAFETRDSIRDKTYPARLAEVADRLRSVRGVTGAALTSMRPLNGFSATVYYPDADTLTHKKPWGMYWPVSSEYFATAGLEIVAGSGFPNGTGSAMPPSVIINTAMAKALWPGENPLGRCVRFAKRDARCNTIIGVVETARLRAVIEEATPQFYLPLANMPIPGAAGTIALRTEAAMAPSVMRETQRLLSATFPGGEPVIKSMTEALEPQYRPWRLGATLFLLFGALAGVVAAVGVCSTVAYNVSQRAHEFGVRVALGAQVRDVVRHVLGDGLRTVVVGILIGVLLSLAAGKLVAALLYGVSPRDPVALMTVAVALLVIAAFAALVPALRASRVDPLAALRSD